LAIRKAKCVEVRGDEADDLEDLVGTTGNLSLDPNSKESTVNWFDGGDSVNFARKKVVEKGNIVKVYTSYGNVFEFELIAEAS
jgi:hypothetical protein